MPHMDIPSLRAHNVYVSLGLNLQSQCGHKHHMDTTFLHAQNSYVSLGLLLQWQGSHMYHMDALPFYSCNVVTCITCICHPFMYRLLMCPQDFSSSRKVVTCITWILFPSSTVQVSFDSRNVVTCITWILLSFMHRILMCPQDFVTSSKVVTCITWILFPS